jgi:hypothetical protein
MSATATPTAAPRHPSSNGLTVRRSSAPGLQLVREPAPRAPRERGGVVLFQVPFASAMSDSDLALLARTLDLVTQDANSPGVVRLDHFSGLFLKRRATAGQWVLEARTWGQPAPESVHEWNLVAAGAASELDPAVPLPERLSAGSPEIADRPLGRAANKRLARIRRRLVGVQ